MTSKTQDLDTKYRYWRRRIFYGMYVGYFFYYFTRKSFTFVIPTLIQDLGFQISDLGFIGTILSLTYGASKFISGILSDRSNPRYFMSIGLIVTGILNIFVGFSSSIIWFAVLWGLNGWFQGWGWPPCARLLSLWYSQNERGRWWGFWNTAQSLGGAIIPFVISFGIYLGGWRVAMYIPGAICIAIGLFIMNRLRDTPQSLDLPSIEEYRNDLPEKFGGKQGEHASVKEILLQFVLRNKFIWLLSFSYFLFYVIRQALNDYMALYFMNGKGYAMVAAFATIFWFEIGGVFGSLASGWVSDVLFKGSRAPVNILFGACAIVTVLLLYLSPQNIILVDYFLMFVVGFFIFGPQMLIGMMAAEVSHKNAAGTATGFTGCWAYLGAATAGYPVAKVIEVYGWSGFFIVMMISGTVGALFLLPLWKIKTHPAYQSLENQEIGE